jgi:hypothetical protein
MIACARMQAHASPRPPSSPQVNFDPDRFRDYIIRADELTRRLKAQLAAAGAAAGPAAEPLPWWAGWGGGSGWGGVRSRTYLGAGAAPGRSPPHLRWTRVEGPLPPSPAVWHLPFTEQLARPAPPSLPAHPNQV